jgi:hypothetical protein
MMEAKVCIDVKFSAAECLGYHKILENLWFVEESFNLTEQESEIWKFTMDKACCCDVGQKKYMQNFGRICLENCLLKD